MPGNAGGPEVGLREVKNPLKKKETEKEEKKEEKKEKAKGKAKGTNAAEGKTAGGGKKNTSDEERALKRAKKAEKKRRLIEKYGEKGYAKIKKKYEELSLSSTFSV